MKIDIAGSTPRFLRLAEADLPGLLASGSLPTAPEHEAVHEQTSGWKGVFLTTNGRYAVSIQAYGDRKHLRVFGTFGEACGAVGCEKLLHGDYARKALRPLARTSNAISLPLPAAAEGGTLKAHIATDLSRIALAGGAGHPSALPIAWLKVRCYPEGSIPANWPVRIHRDLILCSIGIYPLYDRCGGPSEEKPNGLCS
jgi:hypothetical protein